MTLIEVLVAFVVLSLTLGVILQIFSGGLRNARLSDAYSRALLLAESRLETAGVTQPLVPGTTTGQLGDDLRWQLVVSPWVGEDGSLGVPDTAVDAAGRPLVPVRLYEARVRVGWTEGGRERAIELATLRLGPSLPGGRP